MRKPVPDKRLYRAIFGLLLLFIVIWIVFVLAWNGFLNQIPRQDAVVPTLSAEEEVYLTNDPGSEPAILETTSEAETWPVVVSDQVVTNFMLVGQNWRPGEENKLSDTMILCSLNRENGTLTLVSILRDLYVPLPAYAGHGPGRNRINVCYPLGCSWTGTAQGGMEMLALCVEQNFGVRIDHTIEVGFDTFCALVDTMGGVTVELDEEESEYMTETVTEERLFSPGECHLNGSEALTYARMRSIDTDRDRTQRQRDLVFSLIRQCRELSLTQMYDLATEVLPLLVTDMTNEEITGYLWELLPMVSELRLESMVIPVGNEVLPESMWVDTIDIYGYPSDVIKCDTRRNGEYLRQKLGLETVSATTES